MSFRMHLTYISTAYVHIHRSRYARPPVSLCPRRRRPIFAMPVARHRRHAQRDGHADLPGDAGGCRHRAGEDRPPRLRGAGLTRPDPASRRCRHGLLRSSRPGACDPHVRRVVRPRPGAGLQPGAPQHGGGPDHRLPLRARPGHPDLDHGRNRQGRRGRGAVPECGGPRATRVGAGGRARQDRHPHRGKATGHRHRSRRWRPRGGDDPRARRRGGARFRTSAGRRDRARGRGTGSFDRRGKRFRGDRRGRHPGRRRRCPGVGGTPGFPRERRRRRGAPRSVCRRPGRGRQDARLRGP